MRPSPHSKANKYQSSFARIANPVGKPTLHSEKKMAYHCCWVFSLLGSFDALQCSDQPMTVANVIQRCHDFRIFNKMSPRWFGVVWSLAAAVCEMTTDTECQHLCKHAANGNIAKPMKTNGNVPPRPKTPSSTSSKACHWTRTRLPAPALNRLWGKNGWAEAHTPINFFAWTPRSKLWDFVFHGEANSAWLPIMMRVYMQIDMCSVIASHSPCVQLCGIENAEQNGKPMPLQEHLSPSVFKFQHLTSASNQPTTLGKKILSHSKNIDGSVFPDWNLMGHSPWAKGHFRDDYRCHILCTWTFQVCKVRFIGVKRHKCSTVL